MSFLTSVRLSPPGLGLEVTTPVAQLTDPRSVLRPILVHSPARGSVLEVGHRAALSRKPLPDLCVVASTENKRCS
jgi:hypothetical protein